MASSNPPSNIYSSRASPAIKYLDTTAAYDLWSEVYDTDGNFLQALDTIEMKSLLPELIAKIEEPKPWKLVDLGCGTGRNTSALLQIPNAVVVGLDASPKMLNVAEERLGKQPQNEKDFRLLHLKVYDILKNDDVPAEAICAEAVVSTLVLEHVPIANFFEVGSKILKPGGLFLVTNMHSEMGGISQAGFVDPRTGDKIRPKSYSHRVADVVAEGSRYGFDLASSVLEKAVDEPMSRILGERAKKWIGVTVWFGMIFRKTRY